MSFEHYVRSGTRQLRRGYTTGTCAALAAAGAAELLLTGVAIAMLGNLLTGALLTGLGAGTDVPLLRDLCRSYVQPLITATPLFFLNFLLYFFVLSDDNPGLASLGMSVGSILDLALNILFVLVMHKGVQGAVYATIIAQAGSVLILSVHLFSGRKGILRLKAILSARADRRKIRHACRDSLKTGFSASISYLFQFLFLLIGNHLLLAAGLKGTMDGELAVAVFDLEPCPPSLMTKEQSPKKALLFSLFVSA